MNNSMVLNESYRKTKHIRSNAFKLLAKTHSVTKCDKCKRKVDNAICYLKRKGLGIFIPYSSSSLVQRCFSANCCSQYNARICEEHFLFSFFLFTSAIILRFW